jgi:hypothetical protein
MQAAISLGGECLKSEPDAASPKNVNEPMNGDNRIEMASAMMAVEGSLIMVGYRTRLPMPQSRGRTLFIVDEKTGKRLDVQNVSFLGALASRSVGRRALSHGYFMADNAERTIVSGSKITVVIGEMKIENIVVSG